MLQASFSLDLAVTIAKADGMSYIIIFVTQSLKLRAETRHYVPLRTNKSFKSLIVWLNRVVFPAPGELTKFNARILHSFNHLRFWAALPTYYSIDAGF